MAADAAYLRRPGGRGTSAGDEPVLLFVAAARRPPAGPEPQVLEVLGNALVGLGPGVQLSPPTLVDVRLRLADGQWTVLVEGEQRPAEAAVEDNGHCSPPVSLVATGTASASAGVRGPLAMTIEFSGYTGPLVPQSVSSGMSPSWHWPR